ncbi:DUF2723 domain-containing protein [Allomuricauda sp. SCSIO 65647]|uniref:glycosyltransferase family 117 protein n=1 Tax=Allomuricauda sp. SCSIO 65647 TaxID=2908843 RepID=UPI001F236987|nr:DUF2723 domain-containing protein [Muricauda sp. SCSIO 65647]UJH68398.1 DUF2723 domain-containing protein [Muricauda sp. SCSIO 65647]
MFAKNFAKWDTLIGWASFTIALIVYALTVEPTGSFWDAGEYISTSAKLQVGHPPGAPLLQMIGAFFAMFAFGDTTKIALMVNCVSVVSSAFTILFAFWTITNLAKKLISGDKKFTNTKAIAVLGSGLVGALAFTFSDSFWFNSAETEVYAAASLILALLFWLGLKWVDNLHEPRGHRWLLLICFVIGLTFGIHFMGFLAIPAVGLLFYFKRYKTTTVKNFLLANIVVIALLMLVYKYSLTYVLKLFGWSEVFFINSIGLPFNSGTIIMGLIFISAFYFALRYTRKNDFQTGNLIVLCLMFLVLGFSSWLLLPIRANAKVVVNENNPEDARSLLAYYNMEQYPGVDSPFYGEYFSGSFGEPGDYVDDKPKYEKDEKLGKYVIVNNYKDAIQGPNPKHFGLLPRMWSQQHAENYMRFFGVLDFRIKAEYISNNELREAVRQFRSAYDSGELDTEQYLRFLREFEEYIEVEPPTLWQNIKYLFNFQWGYMYVRYFMWNFVGRKNDVQGRYDGNGEWLSGIGFIDGLRLGSQKNLPQDWLDNKARNTYFFLPLLLGIIGIVFQISKNPKQFWVLFMFFIFTGVAIQFYTNPYIFQPRERDYSLVGSFYIFAIWIGLGVYGLFEEVRKLLKPKMAAPLTTILCLAAVPLLMAFQNWDDHDRSARYTARSTAKSYLDSCQEDVGAILFTIGDNDTFPLWYVQEIEGHRTDVRIVCTSLFATDWYIDQMKRKAYESDPIPSQLTHDKYSYGTRDAVYYQKVDPIFGREVSESRWLIKDFMDWIGSDNPQTKFKFILEKSGADLSEYPESNLDVVYYPTNKIRVPVNKKNVLESGLVKEKDSALIVDYIDIDLPRSALTKQRILMLDLLANNDWKRPIYFSGGSFDNGEYIWMKDYLQLDGLVYKLVPIKTEYQGVFEMGRIDSDLMYDIVTKWEWGNSGSSAIYHDPQTRSQGLSFRGNLARLSEQLIDEGKIEKAKEIIEMAMTNMPVEHFGFYAFVEPFVDGYYKVGETTKARELFNKLKTIYQDRLAYYAGVPLDEQYENIEDILGDMEAYRRNIDILIENMDRDFAEKETLIFNEYLERFTQFAPSERELLQEPEPVLDNQDTLDTLTVEGAAVEMDTATAPIEE